MSHAIQPRWSVDRIPDQSDRLAVVTGANSGLGYQVALALARRGAEVVLACRSAARAEAAAASIRRDCPGARLHVEPLNVADLASVQAFAGRLATRHPRLDLLVNNAGVMAIPRALSVDGYEQQFATNHLGAFALTGRLLPLLEAADAARVVAVSSIAARFGRIALGDLMQARFYNPWLAYNQSKLANLMFGLELQRRLRQAGCRSIATIAHPGAAETRLFASPGQTLIKRYLMPAAGLAGVFHDAASGALPLLYAATAADARPGGYYGPSGLFETRGDTGPAWIPPQARRPRVAAALWEASEHLTGLRYP